MIDALVDIDDDDLGYDDQADGDYVLYVDPRLNEKECHFAPCFDDSLGEDLKEGECFPVKEVRDLFIDLD